MGELKVMFPMREIILSEGRRVKMIPIPLRHVPSVIESFLKVAGQLEGKDLQDEKDVSTLLSAVSSDVLGLLNFCLVDSSIDDMTIADAPALILAFIEQNLSEETIKNWSSLLSRVMSLIPGEQQAKAKKIREKALKRQ